MIRLAIVTTHPIQYYAPIFQLLHERKKIEIKVFYTLGQPDSAKFDPGFGREVNWDIPLLEGYPFEWMENTSQRPGTRHFKGIIVPRLIDHITKWHADAILVIGWANQGHLKAIRHFKNKIPVYFRGDSTLMNHPGVIKKVLKLFFLRWVYAHISHAFYVGRNNKAYFKAYGLKEAQLSFAPHAVDNTRFAQDRTAEAQQLRLSLNIKADDILVLFAGKFEPVKDLGTLLSAFENLRPSKVHLLLAGNGMDEPVLKARAKRSQATEHIHFIDFQNQSSMPVLYQACDLFCLPSKSETWGLSVNEAMACGKAILISDKVGCAPDLVIEGKNGLTFLQGNSNDLAKALEELTLNKEILAKFGQQSRQLIGEFTFEKIAVEIENVLLGEHQ